MYNWFNYSRLKRQFENQLKENAGLREENKNLEDILNSIGEDGTIEHNNAIKLRQENAKLNLQITELTKEVLGLRHLKTENVELIERLQKEGDSYGITFNQAKTQIIQNDYKKCAEERDEYKHQLNAANKEIEVLKKERDILKRWRYEQLIVNKLWDKVDDYVRYHDDAPLGNFVANTCLDFLKERDEQKAEIERLKKDIQDYIFEKSDEYNTLKALYERAKKVVEGVEVDLDKSLDEQSDKEPQKHPMYPLHWGGYDKNIIDFVESEFSNEDPLEGKSVSTWCYKCQHIKEQCKCDKYVNIQDLPKTFPDEFQEPTWEEAASNLALKLVKLEKKIQDLTRLPKN